MVRPMLLYDMKAAGEILGLNAACLLGQVREGRVSYTLTSVVTNHPKTV